MTSARVETDYTACYEDSSDWCHDCNSRPPLDKPSRTAASGVAILRAGTTWDCPACGSRWVVARIEEVGLRWMTAGAPNPVMPSRAAIETAPDWPPQSKSRTRFAWGGRR